MINKAIKCKNKKCREVFHIPECRIHGGENDKCAITIKCSKCGREMEVPVLNKEYHYEGDNYTIVAERYVDDNEEWMELQRSMAENTAVVSGFEGINEPLHCWDLHSGMGLWKDSDAEDDYELSATLAFFLAKENVHKSLAGCQNACLADVAGFGWCRRMFVEHHYRSGRKKLCAVWAKDLDKCEDMNTEGLYLIHHSRCKDLIDGIYSRDVSLLHLERLLVRWRMLSERVVVATPFIGYDFAWSKDSDKKELIGLWQLLNGLLDMDKTLFYTRYKTYLSLKKDQKELEIPADVLKEWDLMMNLQKVIDNPKTRDKMKEQFHLKVYAGVFRDRVELYSGSYNVQLNSTMENMLLRNITRERFKVNYMDVMVDGFAYENVDDVNVLHIVVDENNNVSKCATKRLSEINAIVSSIK